MLCSSPFRRGVGEFGCMQCAPCRMNRRRIWTARIMLELTQHDASSFCTLTYNKEHFPCDGNLSVRDVQLFLKRLRLRAGFLRYFAVGEYGDFSLRPHYHLALFGVNDVEMVSAAWDKGWIHVGELNGQSAAYLCGYVMKGMTSPKDLRLKGLRPEFARMSLRPGIGAGAVKVISEAVTSRSGASYVSRVFDVPGVVRQDGSLWPIGRYLSNLVREAAGVSSVVANEKREFDRCVELRAVGAREFRESRRVQQGLNAVARRNIASSKRRVL